MKHKLLEILACPMDKHHPLELKDFESDNDEIISGLLICSACGRYFPIMEKIPSMLPDELRDEAMELEFLEKWVTQLPPEVAESGRPFKPRS